MGKCWGRWGGDERPAGAAASLSSCQMSLKGWKNRLGRAWKGQAPGGTSAIPGEIQKMHMLGKPWAPLPAPQPAPPPALMPWVGGPGKWGGTGSWHGCGDSGMVLSIKSLLPLSSGSGGAIAVTAASWAGVFWRLEIEMPALVLLSPWGAGNMAACSSL